MLCLQVSRESLKYNEDPITRSHSNMWRSGLFFADIGRTQAPRVFNYWWLLQRTRSPRWACLYYSKHPPDISKQTEHGNVMCNLKAGKGSLDLVRALVPGKWGADGCTHHSLIHLPSILRCFGTHLLPLSVFFCNMMAPGGDVASSLHKPLLVFQPFFFFLHSHVVLLIQASFSVHYTFHPPGSLPLFLTMKMLTVETGSSWPLSTTSSKRGWGECVRACKGWRRDPNTTSGQSLLLGADVTDCVSLCVGARTRCF